MLLGAALGGVPAAGAAVSLQRTDVTMPAQPDSVAIGDLDGKQGKDIVVGLWSPGKVGVMLNHGDGTFAAMQQYTAGPECAGLAEDVTLGDVTQPAPGNRLLPDGKLDAYVACTPYVVRLTGDGTGKLNHPEPINLGVQQYLGSATLDMLTLMRRPDGSNVPLLVYQRAMGSFGRELCVNYNLDPGEHACAATPVQGPLAVGDLNGSAPGVPPDEIVTYEGGDKMGIFGFAPTFPLTGPTARAPSRAILRASRASSPPRSGISTTTTTSTCSWASPSTAWPRGCSRSTRSRGGARASSRSRGRFPRAPESTLWRSPTWTVTLVMMWSRRAPTGRG
jgi:hypothetical protein